MSDAKSAILITGWASGIGLATAQALSSIDQPLVLIDRDMAGVVMAAALEGRVLEGSVDAYAMDVSDPAAWEEVAGDLPPLSGAVLCAGISRAAPIADMEMADWRAVLSVNLDGAFLSLKAALSKMVDGGAIVAVSSATAQKAAPMTAAYGASKAGLEQLVRVAALEAAPRQIRVNAVAPAGVKTPMFSDQAFFADLVEKTGSEAAAWAALAEGTPLGRFAEPEEVAAAAVWLLSDAASLMTGTIVDLNGGYGL